jgi:cytochrome c
LIGIAFGLLVLNINPVFAEPPQGPNLGQPATPEQIARWDIGVMPDGEGLPEGEGTVSEGKLLYDKLCASCHGPEGAGGTADQLAGAKMELTSDYPEQTIGSYWPYATTLFDMTRRSMPMDKPGTLANDEVYAITAWLLYLNNIIGETDVMNAETLPQVQMPNRDGFINVYEQEEKKK